MKSVIYKFLICCTIIVSIISLTAFAQNSAKVANDETINVIKLLEIANGDQNGNMNFENEVTRAEFIKMAISASTSKETAASIKLNISLFPDVKNSYWCAGYISVAINKGLVNGYLDGTFRPNNKVTLEEAATIVLRLLGYSDSDFVGSYPDAQLKKYEDLDLDENITAIRGSKLTREECMILLYNALSAKTKQGQVYCTTLGVSVNNEGKLDYSALLEDKLDGPIIVSDTSNIFTNSGFVENENTNYILNNAPSNKEAIKVNDVVYYSNIINTVFSYRKTATGIVTGSNSNSVTISGKSYSLSTAIAKDKLSLGGKYNEEKSFVTLILGINDGVIDIVDGDIAKISENSDNASHLAMISSTISKAAYVKSDEDAENWNELIPFDTENSSIYYNGKLTDNIKIKSGDVIYHSKAFNSIWVYRKTVSGTIESITPITAPTSVTVSGKNYSVVTSDAAFALSIYGSYDVGDKVTLILGLNDECVAITDTKTVSGLLYGVVTATGEKTYVDKNGEDYKADYVTVTDPSNTSYTYEHSKKHISIGDIVKVTIADNVSITKISTDIGKNNAAIIAESIKNGKFTDDCEIIDVNGPDTMKIKPERLSGTQIDPEQFVFTTAVLYFELEENNYISKLILKNFTGDLDDYGVVTSSSGGTIKYMTDKNEKNLSGQTTGCSIGAARLRKENGSVSIATSMTGVIENIQAITSVAVYDEKDNEYLLADDVKVFIKNTGYFNYSSIEEISKGGYEITAYYDKLPKYGGRIRVITAIRKV